MRKIFLLLIVCIGIFSYIQTAFAMPYIFVEGVNEDATPASGVIWAATQVAWLYTPSQTYDLYRIEFYTGRYDRDNMTMELRRAYYSNPPGEVLSSGTFNHKAEYGWQGANITPYRVAEGGSYWVTFWFCDGLWANYTDDVTAERVEQRYGFNYDSNYYMWGTNVNKPMMKFYTVPEPSSMLLLGFGLLGAGIFRRKR